MEACSCHSSPLLPLFSDHPPAYPQKVDGDQAGIWHGIVLLIITSLRFEGLSPCNMYPERTRFLGVLLAQDFCVRDFPSQPTAEGCGLKPRLHPACM